MNMQSFWAYSSYYKKTILACYLFIRKRTQIFCGIGGLNFINMQSLWLQDVAIFGEQDERNTVFCSLCLIKIGYILVAMAYIIRLIDWD